MYLKSFIETVIIDLKKFKNRSVYQRIQPRAKLDVPYYSQWESKNLVKDILTGKLDARKDPEWKNSGAKDLKEYLHWSWNTCGMACLKMILESRDKESLSIVELGKRCAKYGGYIINSEAYETDDYKHSIDGLYYKPFVTYIKKEFDIDSKIVSPLILEEILESINRKNLVIASVSQRIRISSDEPIYKGGHLVLVVGYDLASESLFIHNPSGLPKESQEYAEISFKDFERFFAHRGIIIAV